MRVLLTTLVLASMVIAGCEACGHDGADAEGAEGEGAGTGGGEGDDTNATGGQDDRDPGPAPALVVRLVAPTRGDDAYPFVVENHGDAEVSLRSRVTFEQRAGDAWTTVSEIQSVSLRMDCETEPPECIPLAAGAALHPPAWSGMIGDAQCDCERCVAAPTGDYRLVVTTCNGAHHIASDPVTR